MSIAREFFEEMYREGTPPWDAGEPLDELVEFVKESKPTKALDIGCGTGTDAVYLAKKGFDVSGIDISEEAIKLAKSRAEKNNVKVKFRVGDVLLLPYKDSSFGFVLDNGCFHILDKKFWPRYIEEVLRVMKPKAKYLMKCFSDRNEDKTMPHKISEKMIKKYFSGKFDIISIKPVSFKGLNTDRHTLICFMEKK